MRASSGLQTRPLMIAIRMVRALPRRAIEAKGAGPRSRRVVRIQSGDNPRPVYGINTGFGALSEMHISASDVRALQRNLVRSHSCGVGPDLPEDEVRAMIVLRAQVLSLG